MKKRTWCGKICRDSRGATIVEYAMLLSVVMVMGIPALRLLGREVAAAFQAAVAAFGRA